MRVLLLLAAIVVAAHALNTRPIIGILTLPCYDPDCQSSQSFPASYSKFLEAAGARVVPLPYNWSSAQMDTMLGQINGVLFTGGGAELDNSSPFFQQVQHIFGKVVALNQAGIHFPLWGTCLGFEALVRACSNDPHILFDNYDSWNYSVPIVPTSLASQSRMFMSPFGGEVLKAISTNAYPFHNHHSGVRPDSFAANPKLASFFNALATNVDRSGNPFVSLIEGKSMPIYGSQFHPEKNLFEWNTFETIDHSLGAVHSMQYLANFFVQEARQNDQSFSSAQAENRVLIYNYAPAFTGVVDTADFVQTYYF